MQEKTRAVVLSYVKYGDNSIIATMYTEKHGRQSFLIKGVKGKKARFRLNLFQPLYLLSLDVNIKSGRALQRIQDLKIELPFHSIPYDIVKSTQAMFLAEMLGKALKEAEKNQDLFDFLYHSIAYFDALEQGKSNFHILFLLHLTRFLGFYPNNNYQEGFRFDLSNGCFSDELFSGNQYVLDADESKLMNKMLKLPFHELHRISLSGKQREMILEKLILYYALHLENVLKIRSLPILHDIFR